MRLPVPQDGLKTLCFRFVTNVTVTASLVRISMSIIVRAAKPDFSFLIMSVEILALVITSRIQLPILANNVIVIAKNALVEPQVSVPNVSLLNTSMEIPIHVMIPVHRDTSKIRHQVLRTHVILVQIIVPLVRRQLESVTLVLVYSISKEAIPV